MFKSIVKEIFIIILLMVAVALVLGIILYDYNPSTRKVPNKVETYVLSQEMQDELNETIETEKTQNIVKTYRVSGQDLKVYEASDDYDKGKPNPFSMVINTGNGNTEGNTEGSEGKSGTGSTSTSSSGESQGKFLNTVGK